MALTYIRPDADDTDGTWTNESDSNTNLFQSIDETVASDADYIKSVHLPDHDICKIRLSDPSVLTMRPATVHYRFKKRGETTQQINLDVSLLQGSTEIAKWTETDITTSYVDGSQALTLAQFNSISDFTNLYLQFDASSSWWLAGSTVDLWFEDNLYHLTASTDSAHLLLHCDGADASTTFIDATGRHQVSVAGNAQVDIAQSKFGGASALFDGTGDYLSLDGSSDFAFGTGDFTVDFWIRWNDRTGEQDFYTHQSATGDFQIYKDSSTHTIRMYRTGIGDQIVGTTAVVVNTWYHIALARASGSTKLFVNGTQEGSTYTDSNSYTTGSGFPIIGAYAGGSLALNGWLDEFRVLKGNAAWTTTFTPPTAPYNVALSGPYAHLSCSRASIGYAKTSSGTLTQFAANELRITDLGLLVEDARTNLQLQSQDLTTTWGNTNTTDTANQTASPDGTTTADLLAETAANGLHFINDTTGFAVTNGTAYTLSVYLKKGPGGTAPNWVQICANFGAGIDALFANFNLNTGATGTASLCTSTIESLASGWYRCSVTATANATSGGNSIIIAFCNNTDAGARLPSYAGATTSDVYVWGAQFEAGSFPSTYIPTTSAAATRAADAVTILSGSLDTRLKATIGTGIIDIKTVAVPDTLWRLIMSDSGANFLNFNTSNTVVGATGGYGGGATLGGGATATGGVKIGQAWNTRVAGSICGNGGTTASGGTTPWDPITYNYFVIGSSTYAYFRRITFWDTKLADADLQTMTDSAHTINFTTDAAAIDLDFANAAYNAIALPTDFLIISRASVGYAQTVAGTLQLFGANQLRITDKGLLVEDARTNICLNSNALTALSWNSTIAQTATGNFASSPDGTTTATKSVPDTNNTVHPIQVNAGFSVTAAVYAFSVYAKAQGYGYASLTISDGVSKHAGMNVDLATGSITSTTTDGSPTGVTTSTEVLGNGWVRLIQTITCGAGGTANLQVSASPTSTPTWDGSSRQTFAGDASSGVLLWGAQCELATFASSLIPTTSSSATRARDEITCISSLNSLLTGSAASIVADGLASVTPPTVWRFIAFDTGQKTPLTVENAPTSNQVSMYDGGGDPQVIATLGTGTYAAGVKVGSAWTAAGGRSVVGGGGTVVSDSHVTTSSGPTVGGDATAANRWYGYFRRLTFWTSRLADATLQGFTNP